MTQLPLPSGDLINWQRISRLCKSLPAKHEQLLAEYDTLHLALAIFARFFVFCFFELVNSPHRCERCKAAALTFHLPALSDKLQEVLKAELAEVNPEAEAGRILREILWPASGKAAEPRRVAVNSLLN